MGEESDCDVHSTKKSHVKRERVIQFLSPSLLSPLESSFELLKGEASKIGTKDPRIDHSQWNQIKIHPLSWICRKFTTKIHALKKIACY